MLQNPLYHHSPSSFRNLISPNSLFPPSPSRYILYIAYGCPYCHRALMLLSLKGLLETISLCITHGTFQYTNPSDPKDRHRGFVFRDPADPPLANTDGFGSMSCEDCVKDISRHQFKTVRDIYKGSGDENGKYSLPVLWDSKEEVIVNNDSGDIMRILNEAFNEFAKEPKLDLFPKHLIEEIENRDKWLGENVCDIVYGVGLTKTQKDYDDHLNKLFNGLEALEKILGERRFLNGDTMTGSDIRLFSTLVRFDDVYYVLFKCCKKRLREFENLTDFVREMYQIKEIGSTVKMGQIRSAYFMNFIVLNPFGIVPGDMGSEKLWMEQKKRGYIEKKLGDK